MEILLVGLLGQLGTYIISDSNFVQNDEFYIPAVLSDSDMVERDENVGNL